MELDLRRRETRLQEDNLEEDLAPVQLIDRSRDSTTH